MKILVLAHREVEQLLSMTNCIDLMTATLTSLARKELHQPLRMIVKPEKAMGVMGLMPAYRSGAGAAYGLKAICVFPGNPSKGKDAHQGGVMLFSGETGEPLSLMNASAITAIRTAAVSAVATRTLANAEAGDLAIIGSGVEARSHLAAMSCVRQLRRVRVVSRTFEHARRFADESSKGFAVPVEAVSEVKEALEGADLIVTATTASEPVLRFEWISPGAHINAVGSSSPAAREVDAATMAAAAFFVDRRESVLNEAGDYLIPAREGSIGPEHIRGELGEVLLGRCEGRTSHTEITLFKSLGLAVEDLACAEYLLEQARATEVGTWVEF